MNVVGFLLGVVLVTCYVPGWTGYAVPTGWLFLSAVLPFLLRREVYRLLNPFTVFAAVSLMWTASIAQGIYDLWKIALLGGAFLLGSMSIIETRRVYLGMAVGLSVSAALALAQWWTGGGILFAAAGQYSRPAGLFLNPNVFGEIAALVSVGLLTSNIYWPLLWTVPSVLLSESRTGFLALVAVGITWSANRYLSVFLAIFVAAFVFIKPMDFLGYRWQIWQSAYAGLTWFGRGAGSYVITSPEFSGFHSEIMPNREEDAHNEFLQLAYQYGLGALLLLPVLIIVLVGPAISERYVLYAFCLIALLNFPLEVPPTGFLGLFAMGRLWRDRDLVWPDWPIRRRDVG
jgi:hypothetical protein